MQRGVKLMPGIKNIIAVASGKGGVGKITTAVNLALALAAEGASVGMLDADIYGPSQPMMLGIAGRPGVEGRQDAWSRWKATACRRCSIGFLIDVDTPMVWRGPMVTQALEQLLSETNWRDLDYLVVDLPPGTGDIQLTLAQKVPVTGAVIVTTPQDIALHRRAQGPQDVREGRHPDPRHRREHGVPRLLELRPRRATSSARAAASGCAQDYGIELLGAAAARHAIREQADSGKPTVVADPDGPVAAIYRRIARRCAVKIAESQRDMTSKFPTSSSRTPRARPEPRRARYSAGSRAPASPAS